MNKDEQNLKPSSVIRVTESIRKLIDIGLSVEMIVTIVKDRTHLGKTEITKVIEALIKLEEPISANQKKGGTKS